MGENEEKIEYTAEELREIENVLNHISQETLGHLPVSKTAKAVTGYKAKDIDTSFEDSTLEEPDDMQFEADEDIQETLDEVPEEIEEEPEEEQEEVQDITDLIHEIKEKDAEEIPEEIAEELPSEEISFSEEIKEEPPAPEEEPEAEAEELDFDSIAEEIEKAREEEAQPEEIPEMKMSEDSPSEEEGESLLGEKALEEIDSTIEEKTAVDELEDFEPADIAKEDKTEITDDFDLDIGEVSSPDEIFPETSVSKEEPEKAAAADAAAATAEEEFPPIELGDLEDSIAEPAEKQAHAAAQDVPAHAREADLTSDLDNIHELSMGGTPGDISLDMGPVESKPSATGAEEEKREEIDLSNDELKKLNKIIQFFHPGLTRTIKDVILNDLLPSGEIRHLVNMLLGGTGEEEVKLFLEKILNKKIDISEKAAGRRRVIAARPEYTKEGRERQARLFKRTGIFAISAIMISLISLFSYNYIYIPAMAKKKIDEGVRLIKRPGVPVLEKQKDYKKAEEIFNNVNDNYIKDYLYGYHSYSRAYFQNKEYDYALEKLNKAYGIDASNVDTLNNLGFFYSKVPESKFNEIRPELQKYYYNKIKPVGPVDKQIDVAIDFYKKALNADPRNITSLYGIGNAYTYLGEYLKAKQFYENILAVDKDSIIGYSGLLNLYIERDAFPQIITIHSDLRYREKLSSLPSALLVKLASYYLGKKRTDEKNIRIDHGIQSSFIKDINDNPYPAVKNVLDALTEKDINYPPLFIQFARLSKEENNLNLMKRNLLTALEKDPDYFAAHLLLAEYYYRTNDPVESYKSCKKALQTYLTPPEFTNEDFYFETEKIGTAYAIMGNIFYYFEKMNARFGDEFETENTQGKSDELANYSIAQGNYEKAIAENYKSGEIFYNLGRIYYVKGQYDKATETWLNLYEDFVAQPELMFALGNAFYHLHNLEASKGEYLKVISIFENKAGSISQVFPARNEHIQIYQTLSSAYNNLGAVYQIQNSESKSNLSYWKSINYAKKIEKENEFARVNITRAFKPGTEKTSPVLDENIASNIDIYRQDFK